MPVRVHLSSHIRSYTGGQAEVQAEGATLLEVMAHLEQRYPGIRFRVIDEQGRIRPHINFFVGGALVRDLVHPVGPGDEVHILASLSGGR
jgi:molybdopterin converting factor small subunit